MAGAGTITPVKTSVANVEKYKAAAPKKSAMESSFKSKLEEVEE